MREDSEKTTLRQRFITTFVPFADKKTRYDAATTVWRDYSDGYTLGLSVGGYIRSAFWEVYTPDGYDLLNKTYNGRETTRAEFRKVVSFLFENRSTYLTSFFGIPNRIVLEIKRGPKGQIVRESKEGLTGGQIFKNLIGWHHEESPEWQKYLNYTGIKPAVTFLWNVTTIACKTAWNILKLATEFIPACLEKLTFIVAAKLQDKYDQLEWGWSWEGVGKFFLGFGTVLTLLSHYGFKGWRLLGRTITSPWKSIRAAWQVGNELGGVKGKIVGGLLAGLSGLITVAVYTILFPLAIKAAIVHGPAFISKAATAITNFVSNSPVCSAIGRAVAKVVSPFTKVIKSFCSAVGLSTAASAVVETASAFAAVFVTVVGGVLERATTKIQNWWHTRSAPEPKQVDVVSQRPALGGREPPGVLPSLDARRLGDGLLHAAEQLEKVGQSAIHAGVLAGKRAYSGGVSEVYQPSLGGDSSDEEDREYDQDSGYSSEDDSRMDRQKHVEFH